MTLNLNLYKTDLRSCLLMGACLLVTLLISFPARSDPDSRETSEGKYQDSDTSDSDVLGSPTPLVTSSSFDDNKKPPDVSQETSSPSVVEAEIIDSITIASIGLLDGDEGFPSHMWRGADRTVVRYWLSHLPERLSLPTAQRMAIKLLTSTAQAPKGGNDSYVYLLVRAEKLMSIGAIKQARDLLALVPRSRRDLAYWQLAIDSALLNGHDDDACRAGREALNQYRHPYLHQTLVLCQLIEGEKEQAELTFALAYEDSQDSDFDPDFLYLLAAALNKSPSRQSESRYVSAASHSPAHLRLALWAGLVPPDISDARLYKPSTYTILTRSQNLTLSLRARAAQKAFESGLISVEELAKIHRQITSQARSNDQSDSKNKHSWASIHMDLLEAKHQSANKLARFLSLARQDKQILFANRLLESSLKALRPKGTSFQSTILIASALLANGNYQKAKPWLAIATGKKLSLNKDIKLSAQVLSLISGLSSSFDEQDLRHTIRNYRAHANHHSQFNHVLWLASVVEGLGHLSLSSETWSEIATLSLKRTDKPSALIKPTLLQALERASSANYFGMVVLLSLVSLGEDISGSFSPITLKTILQALRSVGLEEEAKQLALESAPFFISP